jgi:HlyD family secretion protein
MRKVGNIILMTVILTLIGLIVWNKSRKYTVSSDVVSNAIIDTVYQKRIVPGNLYPLTEIAVKSSISGSLESVFVEIGDKVEIGDRIARIKTVPNPLKLEAAKSKLNTSFINFDNQQKMFVRKERLFKKGIIAAVEFELHQRNFELSKEQYVSAKNQLTLIKKGFIEDTEISNIVKSTASGTVIDLPLNEGVSVTEQNNFNNGTTLAVIANVDTFLFRGMINEVDMIYFKPEMKISLHFNAYKNQVREAVLNKISAKGKEIQGVMKYFIEAKLKLVNDSIVIRSGYSANAEIILQKREDVLTIQEKHLRFQRDSAYVTLVNEEGVKDKRFVDTGLSDGIKIEITKGLTEDEQFLVENE